ncbi:MAG: bifunctional N-acetylglucosamine-1-phosphate uridyltransferase/glucosamine-1-phosphate acetyltransferase [Limnochordia bacterium]|jgi:bifunctional UDP-N-acetylglucosamine pyrophosphorylase/glucosamine-1-phosphate N-acetyltransferase|nr:NTP transferase domain-containing protein [Bacillota bacterium]NLL07380.1 NTP transferase domain-containing protein [Bacillota bacterium]HBG09134.1 bifunctional UDP-N-acetylglucosamine diphosphorylase/glucosamine-1-phosphate N-acetyltransferase GlmU [Bacillota bacterium]
MAEAAAIILAAGQGTRMNSDLAKVLHRLAGLEMVNHAVRNVRLAQFEQIIVVVGYQGEQVKAALEEGVLVVEQKEQLGTGHAVDQCRDVLRGFQGPVLVTYGDTPLFRSETFQELLAYHVEQGAAATIVTAHFDDPTGYGRILRGDRGEVLGVVEHKDATPEQRRIQEINTGTYIFQSELLFHYLAQITPDNAQAEYYLPDVLPRLLRDGHRVAGFVLDDPGESLGINDRIQLAEAEAILRERICRFWQKRGVTIIDPKSTWIEWGCQIGRDTVIYPGCLIQGGTRIGENCRIGPYCRLSGAEVESGTVLEYAVVVDRTVGKTDRILPFSYITK